MEPKKKDSTQPTTRATAPTFVPATSAPVPVPTTALDASQQLQAQRNSDVASLSINGRWIAQLSSKYDGIVDATQVAANGTTTFHLEDILIEHQTLRTRFSGQGAAVYLLKGTDFGKQRNRPETFWITVADAGFTSQDQAKQWCQGQFPYLSGKDLDNVCLARQLNPPTQA